jgi:hypothetical protein
MLRVRVVPALLVLAGCTCPRSLCEQWLVVTVTTATWTVGTYRVDVVSGTAEMHCAIVAREADVPPTPYDITCNQLVISEGFDYDTAGNVDDEVLELRMTTGQGADVPDGATVQVTWEGEGTSVPLVDEVVFLDWHDHSALNGSCVRGCFDAVIPLDLPPG